MHTSTGGQLQRSPPADGWTARFGMLCGGAAGVVAVAVLYGWSTKNRLLVQIGPSFAPMQFNAAACFLAASLVVVLLNAPQSIRNTRTARLVMAGAATFIGAFAVLTLVEYGWGINLGIDELFAEGFVTTLTSHPGRMSPWSAAAFVAMAIVSATGLARPQAKWRTRVIAGAVTFVGLLATSMLVLYVMKIDPALGAVHASRMALHTAALFWILAVGTGACISNGSLTAQRAFRVIPFLLGVVLTLTIRQGVVDRDAAVQSLATKEWATDYASRVQQLAGARVTALERMAARAASGAYRSPGTWASDASLYSSQVLDGQAIAWLNAQFDIQAVEPAGREHGAQLRRIVASSHVRDVMAAAAITRTVKAIHPIGDLADLGVVIVAPIMTPDSIAGYIVGPVHYADIFDVTSERQGYNIEIRHDGEPVHRDVIDRILPDSAMVRTADIFIAGDSLSVASWPTTRRVVTLRSRLPDVILVAGLAITWLVAGLFRALTARSRSEARFHTLFESGPDAGIILDDRARMVTVNSKAAELFRYPRGAMVGRSIGILSPERLRGTYPTETSDWPMSHPVEMTGLRSDGSEVPIEVSLSPIETDAGTLVSAAIRDITDRKALIERLRESDRMKSDFVTTVSHEMRTPLTIIREFTTLVQDGTAGAVSDAQSEHLETVVRNCDRLTGLVGDLLELARLESGKYRMERERTAVEPLLRQCADDFVPMADARNQSITLDIPTPVPDVLCDRSRAIQVVVNLLGNAHKFTPDGGRIIVRARTSGTWVEIEVEDNGVGIAEHEQGQIFGAFVQVGRRDGPGSKGTGLGLNVARQIVELHGGTLRVDSQPGVGSRFTFTLPAYDAGLLDAFLAPHIDRQRRTNRHTSLLLVRWGSPSPDVGGALDAASQAAVTLRRMERDETMFDSNRGIVAVVLDADPIGAEQFVRRLLATLGSTARGLEYAILQLRAPGPLEESVAIDPADATWCVMT